MANELHLEVFEDIATFLIQNSISIIGGIFIFFVFWLVSLVVYKLINKLGNKLSKEKQSVIGLVASFSKTSMIVIGVITSLGSMGVNVNALIAGLGLTGFAIGYALKDSLSNLMAGLLVLFYKPFKLGDSIEIDKFKGEVKKIDLRYTTLKSSGKIILVPNTLVFTKAVTIFS